KRRTIQEVHSYRTQLGCWPWHLRGELEGNAFVRLDAHGNHIGAEIHIAYALEHQVRNFLELNSDFRHAARKSLAGSQEEWNAVPSPVIDSKFHSDIGFGFGARFHTLFVAISRHLATAHEAFVIL